MSTKNRPLTAGLAAFGLMWTSANLAGAQEAALPIPVPAPTNAPAFAVLLMSNGRVIQGKVSLDKTGSEYLLLQKGGTIRFPKKDVERRFASMRELYEYKVANLAEHDSGERMQLAQWCLSNHMEAEAKEHLKALLGINPNDARAERMIASLDASAERMANNLDSEVRTTGATGADPGPREMSPSAIARVRGNVSRALTEPVIFDLPPPLARKRAIEFTRAVHPLLQASCASCHNQTYQGEFQLIQPTDRREWTPEVVMTNLDATLRIVNRAEPLRSDVLAFAVNPHGPNTRPIFHGPNDPKYQVLAGWLRGLKSAEPVEKTGYQPRASTPSGVAPTGGAEGFGTDRFPVRPGVPAGPASAPAAMNGAPKPVTAIESYEFDAVSPKVPAGTRFDVPFVPGGAMPTLPAKPGQAPAAVALPTLPPGTPVPPPDDVIPPTNRPKKKSKLDRDLLEQLLKNRRQP